MKPTPPLICCLILALASCSPYMTVTRQTMAGFSIPEKEQGKLHFVLKKQDLHYIAPDSHNNVNLYEKGRNTVLDSYSYLVKDNILIPKGAHGSLLRFDAAGAILLIDFGEGVTVPFELLEDQNRAGKQIVSDNKKYRLNESRRPPVLCIDTRTFAN